MFFIIHVSCISTVCSQHLHCSVFKVQSELGEGCRAEVTEMCRDDLYTDFVRAQGKNLSIALHYISYLPFISMLCLMLILIA